MHRFGVISNPYARICRKNPGFNDQLGKLIGNKGLFRVSQSTAEIAAVVQDFKTHNVTCIGIVGGDGSINLVLAELLKIYPEESLPSILVLGGGTANVLAINLGLPSKPLKVMSDFLDVNSRATATFHTTLIPSLRINSRVGFLFANGMAARFLELFYKKKGSAKDAALLLFRAIAQATTPKTPFGTQGNELAGLGKASPMALSGSPEILSWSKTNPHVTTVFVSTLRSMALSIPVFLTLDGKHAEFLATSLEGQKLAAILTKLILRIPVSNENLFQSLVSRVKINASPGEPYTIDGELFDAPKEGVIIEIGPKIKFLTTLREPRGEQNEVDNRRHWFERFSTRSFRGGFGSLPRRFF